MLWAMDLLKCIFLTSRKKGRKFTSPQTQLGYDSNHQLKMRGYRASHYAAPSTIKQNIIQKIVPTASWWGCVSALRHVLGSLQIGQCSPVNMGHSFSQQVIPPSEVNWPKATSRKNTGRPPPNRKMKYGIKKAPGRRAQAKEWLLFIPKSFITILKCYIHPTVAPSTHHPHSCSRGMGNATRSPSPQSLLPPRAQSPACWPTSPSAGASPPPHPPAECLDSSQVRASGCLCGSPSGTEASLSVPCCCRVWNRQWRLSEGSNVK